MVAENITLREVEDYYCADHKKVLKFSLGGI